LAHHLQEAGSNPHVRIHVRQHGHGSHGVNSSPQLMQWRQETSISTRVGRFQAQKGIPRWTATIFQAADGHGQAAIDGGHWPGRNSRIPSGGLHTGRPQPPPTLPFQMLRVPGPPRHLFDAEWPWCLLAFLGHECSGFVVEGACFL
jgi:hypothetical protein